jgi:hypothetical protein
MVEPFVIFLALIARSSIASSASHGLLVPPPVSLKHGVNKCVKARWTAATELATLEQSVEDYNADWIATSNSAAAAVRHRRLICMPLDETKFDPPMGVFSHGHVQTGDKMSLPACFWQAIQLNKADVPWLFPSNGCRESQGCERSISLVTKGCH